MMIDKSMKFSRSALVRELERTGTAFTGNSCRCPFHDDQHASAGIFESETGWRFKCQSCGVSGDIFDILGRNAGQSPFVSQRATGGDSGAKYRKSATSSKPSRIFADIEALKAACPSGNKIVYKYTCPTTQKIDLVIIRIDLEDGSKTFRQARPCPGGFEFGKPQGLAPIYNRSRILMNDLVAICEGEKCVHSLAEFGIVATTSPGGAKNAQHSDWRPLAGKRVVLWPDFDDAGRQYGDDVYQILQQLEPVPTISRIDPATLDLAPKEDAFDFIQKLTSAEKTPEQIKLELDKVIDAAKPITSPVSETLKFIQMASVGKLRPLSMPFETLNKVCPCFTPGNITMLFGSEGCGKSFFILQLLSEWITNGENVACFMLEKQKADYTMRVLARLSGNPSVTRTQWIENNPAELGLLYAEHQQHIEAFEKVLWVRKESKQPTHADMIQWITTRAEAGCRAIIVDPISACLPTRDTHIQDNVFISELRRVVEKYQISCLISNHATKGPKVEELQQAGGAAYGRFADNIFKLTAHETKESQVTTSFGTMPHSHDRTLEITKNRNGRTCKLAFSFDEKNLSLREIGFIPPKGK